MTCFHRRAQRDPGTAPLRARRYRRDRAQRHGDGGWENINLTTIRQPISSIIESSIELIVSMLEKPDRYPEARLFPCRVIERGTLRPVAG